MTRCVDDQRPEESRPIAIGHTIRSRYHDGGARAVLGAIEPYLRFHARRLGRATAARAHALSPGPKHFRLHDNTYRYLFSGENSTWLNERCVELPLAIEQLRLRPNARVLEVGNVLHRYLDHDHDVLDKYEHGDRVINQDVISFEPATSYDLIVSISTLEHVGWDEDDLEPEKVRAAITRLTEILAPGGRLWFTVPRGYHRFLDRDIDTGTIACTQTTFLRRTTRRNWHQINHEQAEGIPFGVGFEGAIAIMIGVIDAPRSASTAPDRPAGHS